MMPMARRLNETLDNATFAYSEEEFNRDIELLDNETGDVSEEEKRVLKKSLLLDLTKPKPVYQIYFLNWEIIKINLKWIL